MPSVLIFFWTKKWDAKLSDFALSKIGSLSISKPKPNALTRKESNVVGTYGYIPPEYMMCHEVSEKVDVYSLGVVCRRGLDFWDH
ncbi:hypothetical protein SLA2020_428840 [Shorea laevis]